MKTSELQLPTNKKFGFFFSAVFLVATTYFYINNASSSVVSTLSVVGLSFLIATLVNPDVLLPLNRLWMRFGLLLGMIISPIVMGIIFFGLFTPMSLTMRLFRRDELRLRFKNKKTHWILRDFPDGDELSDSFKHQY
ncbi:SxtJ family membrane protein [Gammaproteobacteria bacterium]|nr:SxtJ family membrane protein [Gammaproteobacteria bacterium]